MADDFAIRDLTVSDIDLMLRVAAKGSTIPEMLAWYNDLSDGWLFKQPAAESTVALLAIGRAVNAQLGLAEQPPRIGLGRLVKRILRRGPIRGWG